MSRYTGLDWAAMMRAGMPGLGLSPQEFWRLSPAELLLMLGETGPAPMRRSIFDALAARFPDQDKTSSKGDRP
jgi:uncharacterized phage protein (TIGR02216 family)